MSSGMKRLALFVLCAMLCGAVSLSAQEHSLQFIYVVKDHTTRVTPLVKELVDLYDFIRTDNCASAVFYMRILLLSR